MASEDAETAADGESVRDDDVIDDDLNPVRDVLLLLSDYEDAEDLLHETFVATVFSYARRLGTTPRSLLDELFSRMPPNEEWREELLPLMDALVLELSASGAS